MSYSEALTTTSDAWLARRDPRLKLVWLTAISLASVLVDSTPALLLLCGATLIVALALGWSARTWLFVGGLLLTVVWGTILSQAMFYTVEPRTRIVTIVPEFSVGRFSFAGLSLYREGAAYGLLQSSRIVAVMLAGLSVCLSTSPERLLAALAWLRVPSAVSFMTVAALRFLPTIADQWSTVRRSARLRGYRPRLWQLGNGVWDSWRTEAALLVPVIAAALRRAATLATSLTTRGFDAARPRTIYPVLKMTRGEHVALLLLFAGCLLLAGLKSAYWLSVAGLVRIPALATCYEFARDWL
jgi:energy-coupling factor transport system permease protein